MPHLLALLITLAAPASAPYAQEDLSRPLLGSPLPSGTWLAIEEDNPTTRLLRRIQVSEAGDQMRVDLAAWSDHALLGSQSLLVDPRAWTLLRQRAEAARLSTWMPARRYGDQFVTTVALGGAAAHQLQAWTPSESGPGHLVAAVERLTGIDALVRRWQSRRRASGLALEDLRRSPFDGALPDDLRLLLEHEREDGLLERIALFENVGGQLRLAVARGRPGADAGPDAEVEVAREVRTLPLEASRELTGQLAALGGWSLPSQTLEFLTARAHPERFELLLRQGAQQHRLRCVGGVAGAQARLLQAIGEAAARASTLIPAGWIHPVEPLPLLERSPHWAQAAIDPEVEVLLLEGSLETLEETRWEVRALPGGAARVTRVAFGRGSERPAVKERQLTAAQLGALWSGLDRLGWTHLGDVHNSGSGAEHGHLVFLRRGAVSTHLSIYAPVAGSAHEQLVTLLTGTL